MRWPEPALVWQAIETYLEAAYDGEPPSAVRSRLQTLKALDRESFYDCAVFEKKGDAQRPVLRLRLGNRHYPHMKLVIERRPDRQGYLFGADTHDGHCCPIKGAREHREFRRLMELNRQVAVAIEGAWEKKNLPTFKSFLKEDLARRQGIQG